MCVQYLKILLSRFGEDNFKGKSIHGKAKKSARPYTRTRSEKRDAICGKNKLAKPKAVYGENHKLNRPVDGNKWQTENTDFLERNIKINVLEHLQIMQTM